jgi:hypothetical protein
MDPVDAAGPLLVLLAGGLLMMAACPRWCVATRRGGSLPDLGMLELTPPFVAAVATNGALSALLGLLVLVSWCIGLWVLLIAVERIPLHSSVVAAAHAEWDHPCDSLAAVFGSYRAPLVGKILRYQVRSAMKYGYPFVLPAVAAMSTNHGGTTFLFALGVAPALGFVANLPLSANLFGFDGQGFRRYFLWPMPAGHVFQTAAFVSVIPGAILLPLGLVLGWSVEHSVTARMILCCSPPAPAAMFFMRSSGRHCFPHDPFQ